MISLPCPFSGYNFLVPHMSFFVCYSLGARGSPFDFGTRYSQSDVFVARNLASVWANYGSKGHRYIDIKLVNVYNKMTVNRCNHLNGLGTTGSWSSLHRKRGYQVEVQDKHKDSYVQNPEGNQRRILVVPPINLSTRNKTQGYPARTNPKKSSHRTHDTYPTRSPNAATKAPCFPIQKEKNAMSPTTSPYHPTLNPQTSP